MLPYPWLIRRGNVINFIAGPLIEEYGMFSVGGKTYGYDTHQQPDHLFVVSTGLLVWRMFPWPVRLRTQWISNNAILLPWEGGRGEPEPNTQLPMGYDNHIYNEGNVIRAVDLLVIAKSPAAAVAESKRLIKSNPQIRAILDATSNEIHPPAESGRHMKFPVLKEVKPIW